MSEGARQAAATVLIYTALTLAPMEVPVPRVAPEPPHAIVQPFERTVIAEVEAWLASKA